MRKLICTIVSLAALFAVAPAGAHLYSHCGHYDRWYNNGNSLADYLYYSYSNGTHWHVYGHWYRAPNGQIYHQHNYTINCNGYV